VRLSKLQKLYLSASDKCAMVFVLWQFKNWKKLGVLSTQLRNLQIAAFTSKDDGWWLKNFILQLAIDTKIFSLHTRQSLYDVQNHRRSRSGVRLTTHLTIKCLIVNYCMRWRGIFKGFSLERGRQIFPKNHCASLFNEDLSNVPNFCRIHLAGQYL
jgi:hypothetical protein